jgi:hypothetical protein
MNQSYISKLTIAILKNNESSRDDMMLVVKSIHDFEISILGKEKSDYYECFFSGKLSSVKTIDRIWRKIQEKKPELRGKEWDMRQVQAGIISINVAAEKYGQLNIF